MYASELKNKVIQIQILVLGLLYITHIFNLTIFLKKWILVKLLWSYLNDYQIIYFTSCALIS